MKMSLILVIVFLVSCSSQLSNNGRSLAYSDLKSSVDLNFHKSKIDNHGLNKQCSLAFTNQNFILLSQIYREELTVFMKDTIVNFPNLENLGFWKYRSKSIESIQSKIKRKAPKTYQELSLEQSRKLIGDGMASRLILEDTSPKAIERVFTKLKNSIKNETLHVKEIDNYRNQSGFAYFSEKHVSELVDISNSVGRPIKVNTGSAATMSDGYSGFHLKVKLESGNLAEIQIRGDLINQFSEVMHIVYDAFKGKPIAKEFLDSPEVIKIVTKLEAMDEISREVYKQYLRDFYLYIRQVEVGSNPPTGPPIRPRILEDSLDIKSIYKKVKPFYDDTVYKRNFDSIILTNTNPDLYADKVLSAQIFDSVGHITSTQSREIQVDVLGNIQSGTGIRSFHSNIDVGLKKIESDVDGLEYISVIIWNENKYIKTRRKALRKGEAWNEPFTVPKFDESQALGNSTLKIEDIHYMQSMAHNVSGDYTVIGNAKALKSGKLKTSDLPPLEVWRDKTRKVWSLDHRRLIAYDLSGKVKNVPVTFVDEIKVKEDMFKFQNLDEGESIILKLKDTEFGVVIKK
jgi:ppGpp synthetase/RelA/SpoT-type nucleotidyltranferase